MVTPETVRALVLSLPEVQEVAGHEPTAFRVRGTIFALLAADGTAVVLAVDADERAELLARDPATFTPVPGAADTSQLVVHLAGVDAEELEMLLTEAWRQHAPRRLVAGHDAAAEPEPRPDREPG